MKKALLFLCSINLASSFLFVSAGITFTVTSNSPSLQFNDNKAICNHFKHNWALKSVFPTGNMDGSFVFFINSEFYTIRMIEWTKAWLVEDVTYKFEKVNHFTSIYRFVCRDNVGEQFYYSPERGQIFSEEFAVKDATTLVIDKGIVVDELDYDQNRGIPSFLLFGSNDLETCSWTVNYQYSVTNKYYVSRNATTLLIGSEKTRSLRNCFEPTFKRPPKGFFYNHRLYLIDSPDVYIFKSKELFSYSVENKSQLSLPLYQHTDLSSLFGCDFKNLIRNLFLGIGMLIGLLSTAIYFIITQLCQSQSRSESIQSPTSLQPTTDSPEPIRWPIIETLDPPQINPEKPIIESLLVNSVVQTQPSSHQLGSRLQPSSAVQSRVHSRTVSTIEKRTKSPKNRASLLESKKSEILSTRATIQSNKSTTNLSRIV